MELIEWKSDENHEIDSDEIVIYTLFDPEYPTPYPTPYPNER